MPQQTDMKKQIRATCKAMRSAFCGEERRAADERIHSLFMRTYGAFNTFFIYNSFRDEADTKRIISSLLAAGKKVCLPRVEGRDIVPVFYGELKKGAYGIDEPLGEAYRGDIDVAVVPLLAVNGRGYRLGYGGGYYDRFLRGCPAVKVGIGYDFQRTEFEEECHDVPLDCFLSQAGIIKFTK